MRVFNKYQEYAKNYDDSMLVSGRFSFAAESMKNVVPDIYRKLQIKPSDTLLDIGCNVGELTIPLSFLCSSVTAIDGEACIERLKKRSNGITNLSFCAGDFLSLDIKEKFDCILIYSVTQCLDNYNRVLEFVLKAAELLKGGGRMLVGDMSNGDKRQRFLKSDLGKKVNEEYERQVASGPSVNIRTETGAEVEGFFDSYDDDILRLMRDMRKHGFESYLLPQKGCMPMGYTREDILITKF